MEEEIKVLTKNIISKEEEKRDGRNRNGMRKRE